jgi:hypothetical protein
MKGFALVRFSDGTIARAEFHGYEVRTLGRFELNRFELKLKREFS